MEIGGEFKSDGRGNGYWRFPAPDKPEELKAQCATCRKPIAFREGVWVHTEDFWRSPARNVYCGADHLYKKATPLNIERAGDDVEGCDTCSRDGHSCYVCGEPVSHGLRECESHGRA